MGGATGAETLKRNIEEVLFVKLSKTPRQAFEAQCLYG